MTDETTESVTPPGALSPPGTRLVDVDAAEPIHPNRAAEMAKEAAEAPANEALAKLQEENAYLTKKLGQQSGDVGELRKELSAMRAQIEAQNRPELDYYGDPEGAVRYTVDEALKPLRSQMEQFQVAQTRAALDREYPEWEKTAETAEFAEWVKSDESRIETLQAAHLGDLNAARTIFKTYSEVASSEAEIEAARAEALRSERNRRASATQKGSAHTPRGREFYASDLIDLKVTNPDKYREMSSEIERAYAEGRVKR